MSFKSHYQNLLDSLGVDFKSLQEQLDALGSNLPAYAGERSKPFLPERSAYNWTETSTRVLRAALAKYDTDRVLLSVLGHSAAAGGGDVTIGTQDVASRIRRYLQSIGSSSGTGLIIIDQNIGGVRDSRLSFTGTWTSSGNDSDPYVYTFTANQWIFAQSAAAGTVAEVTVSNNTASVEIYVDDVLQETYTGPLVGSAATAWVTRTYTGLSFAKHKISVKSVNTAGAVVHAVRVRNATGLEISNVGRGGAEVADWIGSAYNNNYNALVHTGLPQVAIITLGANEALGGIALATMKADYTTLLTNLQAAGVACIMLVEAPPPTSGSPGLFVAPATWATFLDAYYDLADTFNVPLVDTNHALGDNATAAGLGMISADGLHLNRKGYGFQAELLMSSLLDYITLSPGKDLQEKMWVQLTQAAYDALAVKDSATLYVIVG